MQAGSTDVVKNFGSDMKDCSKWVTLIKQVCGRDAEDAGIDEVMAVADLTEVGVQNTVYWILFGMHRSSGGGAPHVSRHQS